MRFSALAAFLCLFLFANTAFGQGYRIQRGAQNDSVGSYADQQNTGFSANSVSTFKLQPTESPPPEETQQAAPGGWANSFAEEPAAKKILDAAAFANRIFQTVRTNPPPQTFASVPTNFPRPLNGSLLAPQDLVHLQGKQVTIVMDRSGSMRTEDCAMPMSLGFSPRSMSRWDWCLNQTVDLARQTARVLPGGMTLVFFSGSDSVYHNVRADMILPLFSQNSPDGGTNLVGALKHQLDDYFRSQSMGNNQPLVLAVVTDGDPDSPRALKELIVDATQRMTAPGQISINFLQVGNDSRATDLLDELDNGLVQRGAAYDIVSVTPFREVMARGLARSLVAAVQSPAVARRF